MELDRKLIKKIYKVKKDKKGKRIISKQPKGVLVAGLTENGQIAIGFSLCHRIDRFDYINRKIKAKGLGRRIAEERAIKWSQHELVKIPDSIEKELRKFIYKCTRFYKHNQFVPWVENFYRTEPNYDY